MNRSTTWMLLVLVLALGGAAGWQWMREARGVDFPTNEPLFPELVPSRVQEIRVENLERSQLVVWVLDEDRRWLLVEPLAYPADPAYPAFFLQIAEHNELFPVANADELDPVALKLDPPRAVVTYVEGTPDGERTHVLEMGAVDPDPSRIYVRVRDRIWTTVRNVEAPVDHSVEAYRSKRLLNVSPRNVVELHRSGTHVGKDVNLDALLDTGEWRMTQPLVARLDPVVMGHIVVSAALIESVGFVDDVNRSRADYGLDPAEVELTLVTVADERTTLRFGRDAEDRWHATFDDSPYVFLVSAPIVDVLSLSGPELVDRTVVRATRNDLRAVVLRRGGSDLRIELDNNEWYVSEGSTRFAVDSGAFRDLLSQIEDLELGGQLSSADVAVADAFEGEAAAGGDGFRLELRTEVDQGGTFGGTHTLSTGDEVRLFRRRGDTLIGWTDPRAAELLDWTLEDLRSLNLLEGILEEYQAAGLDLSFGDRTQSYDRDDRGRWRERGSALEAHELVPVLDRLFFLRGERNVPREGRPALADVVTVSVVDGAGDAFAILFGRAPDEDGRVEVELAGRRAIPAYADLYEQLKGLTAP